MSVIEKNIGGEKRAFRFGLGFLGEILETLDTDIVGLGQAMVKNPFKVVPLMLYLGYKSECEVQDRVCDITIKDVNNWLEVEGSYDTPEVNDIIGVMSTSVLKYIPKAPVEETEPKKKLTGTKT